MKRIIDSILGKLGYVLIHKHSLINAKPPKNISNYDLANARGKAGIALEKLLKDNGQLHWLEVGTGGKNERGFDKIDIIDFPEGTEPENYRKLDIIKATDSELAGMGTYDFIRMQHVFEHFTPEDGIKVLGNCGALLETGGYILISCPDIDIVIDHYKNGTIKQLNGTWGVERFGENAPDSFYFSIFCYSVLYEPHLWCYNAEGLIFQLEKSGLYTEIEILTLDNSKSSIPFTHNRADQDVVVLAKKK